MKVLAIIITAYKIDSSLIATLENFKNQKIPENWKVKIYVGVDDCKESASILDYHDLSYYISDKNVGTYVLFNSLMLEAKKEGFDALLRFDWDDVPLDNFLYNGLKSLEQYPFLRASYIKTDVNFSVLNNKISTAFGIFFITNELLSKIGGFNEHRIECDYDLVERLSILGHTSIDLSRFLTKIRIHGLKYSFRSSLPIFYRRIRENSLSSSPKTGHGTSYRNQIKKDLEQRRLQGKLFIEDIRVTNLEFIKNGRQN